MAPGSGQRAHQAHPLPEKKILALEFLITIHGVGPGPGQVGTFKLNPDLKRKAEAHRQKKNDEEEEERRKRLEALSARKMDKAAEEKVRQRSTASSSFCDGARFQRRRAADRDVRTVTFQPLIGGFGYR
eukprot:1157520-Pelagomonas_calceolata.AAC.5